MARPGEKFKAGDIVVLKSGGPDMTIDDWNPIHDGYDCHWFVGGKLQSGIFSEGSLLAADAAEADKRK